MAAGGAGDGADGGLRAQAAIALLGGLALAAALAAGLAGQRGHLRPFLIGWAVLTPYWWYLEHRFFLPAGVGAQAGLHALQALSAKVWLGGMVALATLIWAPG